MSSWSWNVGRACVFALALCSVSFGIAACDQKPTEPEKSDSGEIDKSRIKRGVKPEADAEVAVLETEYGRIVIEFYPNIAPKMVERFKQLVREGVYDNTAFHRIDTNYGIIQGGDPLSKDNDVANDGTGSSTYPNVPAELSDIPFDAGIVGAARGGDVNTANSQFYIQVKPFPGFNEQYTVFGRVIQGLDNARVIMTAPLEEGRENRPAAPVRVTRATLTSRAEFAKSGAVK